MAGYFIPAPLAGYMLTKEEGIVGSPERPLSHLGMVAYIAFWKKQVQKALLAIVPTGRVALDGWYL